jgi:hypothetical protein
MLPAGVLCILALLAPSGESLAGPSSTYATTRLDVEYVGSKTCQGCHEHIYNAHFKTAMGRSMGVGQ